MSVNPDCGTCKYNDCYISEPPCSNCYEFPDKPKYKEKGEVVYPEGKWAAKEETDGSFREYRKNAKRAAVELCYGQKVVQEIMDAKSIGEIEKIMSTARHNL